MAMADVCLHGARAITQAGLSRAAVTIRAGRFGGTSAPVPCAWICKGMFWRQA